MKSLIEQHTPELWKAYTSFADKTMEDGALSSKFKELLAIALSITSGCEVCIKFHLRRAIEKGATEQEIAELLGVVVLMNGAPSDVWPRKIILDELERIKKD